MQTLRKFPWEARLPSYLSLCHLSCNLTFLLIYLFCIYIFFALNIFLFLISPKLLYLREEGKEREERGRHLEGELWSWKDRGVNSCPDQDGESHFVTAEYFYQNPTVFALTTSLPIYESFCLALEFRPKLIQLYDPWHPKSVVLLNLGFSRCSSSSFSSWRQWMKPYARIPLSLPATLLCSETQRKGL